MFTATLYSPCQNLRDTEEFKLLERAGNQWAEGSRLDGLKKLPWKRGETSSSSWFDAAGELWPGWKRISTDTWMTAVCRDIYFEEKPIHFYKTMNIYIYEPYWMSVWLHCEKRNCGGYPFSAAKLCTAIMWNNEIAVGTCLCLHITRSRRSEITVSYKKTKKQQTFNALLVRTDADLICIKLGQLCFVGIISML